MSNVIQFPDRHKEVRQVSSLIWPPKPFDHMHRDINRALAEYQAELEQKAQSKPQPFNPFF